MEERDLSNLASGITNDQHVALLRNAMRLSRDPALGLVMGVNRHISTLDRFAFAMMCCENFRDALQLGCEYQRIVGRFSGRLLFLSVHQEADVAVIQIEVDPALGDLARFAVEDILGNILSTVRWVTGRTLPLREIRCSYPPPDYAASYRKYFHCPVKFGTAQTQVRFDASFLSTRLPLASSNAARMYRAHCQQLINRDRGADDELVSSIRRQILISANRLLSLEECAAGLSLSARTLRRKLQERGLSYQEIVDDVKASLARSYLCSSRLTVQTIAERLGFSEPTSFSRAFRRWTGVSPRTFRNQESRSTDQTGDAGIAPVTTQRTDVSCLR